MMFKYLWDYGEFWSVEAEIMNSVIGMQQCRMFTNTCFEQPLLFTIGSLSQVYFALTELEQF